MITSTRNPKISQIRKLQNQARARRNEGLFVIEGIRLVEEALETGWEVDLALYTEDLPPRGQELVRRFIEGRVQVEAVSDHVMRAASDTQTPQGLLAILRARDLPLLPRPDLVFIPDAVRDPGNLGTMLRTAAAAGVSAVFLPPGSVDPWSPKVMRAGMGAQFRLPVHNRSWEEIEAMVRQAGLRVYLAAAGAGLSYTQADFRVPLALLIGGEAHGAGLEAERLADERVHIPMPGGMESLNAAVAGAILIFEVVRQRGNTASN